MTKVESPGSVTFTFRSICRTMTSMCLSLIETPWSRYTSWISLTRNFCSSRGPLILRISWGSTGPSSICSPLAMKSRSCTRRNLETGMEYSFTVPSSPVTMIFRLFFTVSPISMVPSSSDSVAASFGVRASKSSATRGRPPVMSFVFSAPRGIFARTVPAETLSPLVDHEVRALGQEIGDRPAWTAR